MISLNRTEQQFNTGNFAETGKTIRQQQKSAVKKAALALALSWKLVLTIENYVLEGCGNLLDARSDLHMHAFMDCNNS